MKFIKAMSFCLAVLLGTSAFADSKGALIMYEQCDRAYFYDGAESHGISLANGNISGCPYKDMDKKVYISLKNTFKALGEESAYTVSGDEITIVFNGKKCTVPIEKKFAVRGHESLGNMYVYVIGSDYYIPAELIAAMTGGSVSYNSVTGEIVLYTTSGMSNLTAADGTLLKSTVDKLYAKTFFNNFGACNMYLKSDGETIDTVDGASSVCRDGETLFYTKDYKLYKRTSDGTETELVLNDGMSTSQVYVYGVNCFGNCLYGLATGNDFGDKGKLFLCNTDGKDFKYIMNSTVYNVLRYRNSNYLYFMRADRYPVLCQYNLQTGDECDLIIVNAKDESLVKDMSSTAITQDGFVFANKSMIRFVETERPAYECEWIKIRDKEKISEYTSCGNTPFGEITAVNYCYEENVLYFIDNGKLNTRIIKVDCATQGMKVIKEYDVPAYKLNLFDTNGGMTLGIVFGDDSVDFIKGD